MKMIHGVPVWGDPQMNAVQQMGKIKKDASGVALMADHHLGYSMPIGGVALYKGLVSPSGVGFDIACGNKAVLTDMRGDELRGNIRAIMDDVWSTISFGIGRKNQEGVDHELFYNDPAWSIPIASGLKEKARAQLGTVGSGNHYVDLFTDEQDRVWIGVHFGSRGLGHGIATHFVNEGGGKDSIHADAVLIPDDHDLGREYTMCMALAGRYAYAGRDWVCNRVAKILGAEILDEVHNHHNFAWREEHGGDEYWVVRKGATPAFPGQRGFVGGSMGDVSVILEGVDSEGSRNAFYSTVHGAGRVMSRTEAAGRRRRRWSCCNRECDWFAGKGVHKPEDGACPLCGHKKLTKRQVQMTEGKVSPEMMREWVVDKMGVELRGGGLDESPHAYKRIEGVLESHGESIRVLHTLTPVGVAMACANEFDPYKD